MKEEILCEQKANTIYITINREKRRNALSLSVLNTMLEYLDDALRSDEVGCVCITGAGDRIFSSGADLNMGKDGELKALDIATERYAQLLKTMRAYEKPLIARVNGSCMGGGLGIMLSCDIAISRDDAMFWTPEPEIGLFPLMIGPLLHEHMGSKLLMEMVLTGKKVTATQAVQRGIITRAVPAEELDSAVDETISAINARSRNAVIHGKRAFSKIKDMDFESSLDYLREAFLELIRTDDAREGIRRFFHKKR